MTIYPLPTPVIYQIAAGEVIDSLGAVVRELVENSLDAGATRIQVSVWPDRWQVRVADNGQGMALEDLHQAAQPHSTSKIRQVEDLCQITSLGFRGEALHSLVQLAHVEICSRVSPSDAPGWQVVYNAQGQVQHQQTLALAPGTIVTVSDLFAQWPARRQALPSSAQQLRGIQLTLQHLALCHPTVTWQVHQGDRPWFHLWPGNTALSPLSQMLSAVNPEDLREFQRELPDLNGGLYLVLGVPERIHRRRPDWIKVAINRRVVKLPELEQTLLLAFRRMVPRDRFPVCFLHLQVSPDQVDWNRHPAKAEIYLRHLDHWQEQVTQAIDQTLKLEVYPRSDQALDRRLGQVFKTAEQQGGYFVHRGVEQVAETIRGNLRAVAQLHQMYIVAEHPTGIWLVEQHIAHERVLYEQICDRWQLTPLQPPILLSQLSIAQVEQLQRLGIEVDCFGEQQWAIRHAPALLAPRADCGEALLELSLGGDLQTAQVATACRSAIRNGVPLTLTEMQHLLDQWQQTRHPRTCPHGRPIYLNLEESSLSRFFRRHWVIGKSHGI